MMHNIQKLKRNDEDPRISLVFWGLVAYTFIFFSQIGDRIPVLGKVRIEFLIGSALLLYSLPALLKTRITNEFRSVFYAIFIFFIAVFLSIPTTVAGINTINMLVYFLKAFAIFFIIMAGVNSQKELKIYVYTLAIAIGFIIVEAYIVRPMHNSSGLMRLNAITLRFAHPNALGGIAAAILPIAFYLFHYEKNKLIKLIIAGYALVALNVVFLTQSRSALVGVFAGIIFVWVKSRKKLVTGFLILGGLIVGWMTLDDVTKARYQSLESAGSIIKGEKGSGVDGSMAARYEIILDGLRLFAMRPVSGFGIGGYQIARVERLGRWQVCHNAYVQCLAELGIIGFIPWCLILIKTFRNFTLARKILEDEGQVEDYPFIYHLTYAFQGNLMVHFALSLFGHDPYDYYWWISAAVSMKTLQLVQQRCQEE